MSLLENDRVPALPYSLPSKHDSNTAPPPSTCWLVLAAPTGCGLLGHGGGSSPGLRDKGWWDLLKE